MIQSPHTPPGVSGRTTPALAVVVLWAVVLCSPLIGGCVRVHTGMDPATETGMRASDPRPAPTASPAEDRSSVEWPSRWPSDATRRSEPDEAGAPSRAGVVREVSGPIARLAAVRVPEGDRRPPTQADLEDLRALAAAFDRSPETDPVLARFRTEGPGSYLLVERDATDERIETDADDETLEPSAMYRFVSAQEHPGGGGVELERTWFALYEPSDAAGPSDAPDPARGVVVLLPGMFGTPVELVRRTTRRFVEDGWHVLRMLVHPARATERRTFSLAEPDSASRLAEYFDNRFAEAAYAVRATTDVLENDHPVLASRPRVLVGFSGGAIMGPAVASLEPSRYDAVVLVAGGANALEIADRSNYAAWIDAIELTDGGDLPDGRRSVYDAYLEHSRLDPAHAARAIADKPVLLLHAAADAAVPADTGDALWAALGEPERWVFPFGHEFIFLFGVPTHLPDLVRWVNEHAAPPADGTSGL